MRFVSFDVNITLLIPVLLFFRSNSTQKTRSITHNTLLWRRRRETRDSENNTRTIRQKTPALFYS